MYTEKWYQKHGSLNKLKIKLNAVLKVESAGIIRLSQGDCVEKCEGKWHGSEKQFNPITTIFDTFTNPSSSKYAFIGAGKAEIIFMNDFKWLPEMIYLQGFLNLSEEQNVHLAVPKSHFA